MNNRYFYGLVTPVLFQGCFFKTNQLSYKFYLQLKTLTYTSSISINIFQKHISMFNVNATIKIVSVGVVFNTFLVGIVLKSMMSFCFIWVTTCVMLISYTWCTGSSFADICNYGALIAYGRQFIYFVAINYTPTQLTSINATCNNTVLYLIADMCVL